MYNFRVVYTTEVVVPMVFTKNWKLIDVSQGNIMKMSITLLVDLSGDSPPRDLLSICFVVSVGEVCFPPGCRCPSTPKNLFCFLQNASWRGAILIKVQ